MSETWRVDLMKAVVDLTGDPQAIVHDEPARMLGYRFALQVTAVWTQDGRRRFFQQLVGCEADLNLNERDERFFMARVGEVFKAPPATPERPVRTGFKTAGNPFKTGAPAPGGTTGAAAASKPA